ncbi:MAG: PhnD/SsuA/transferrin family substrate-binding protein [Desulfovibrio sp.]|nr:PhnD/SsuA/transferrin family substrate-binding protein [Desulfovibrio sp.]MBI4960925.1 PhnD/SsuA/transferrin family substrate-binding protein [Desulfovibrio sp.]
MLQKVLSVSLFLLLPLLLQGAPDASAGSVRLGVLANRGDELALQEYQPLATYLTGVLPGLEFSVIPIPFTDIDKAVASTEVDFIIVNPALYVQLERRHGVMRIATMNNQAGGRTSMRFGGVVFTRASNQQINSLEDLKGKRVAAVHPYSMGGWLVAYGEFFRKGINPIKDFQSLVFVGTQDASVKAVLAGEADAGTARTDTLEQMAEAGTISLSDVKVIPHQEHGPEYDAFPFLLSTRLYPEWAVARLAHVSDDQARRVAAALLIASDNFLGGSDTHIRSFTVPLNYQPVDDLLRELKVKPYDTPPKVELREFLFQHRIEVTLAGLALIGLFLATIYFLSLSGRLRRVQAKLLRELAEREKAEASMQMAKDIAERASRAKSFLVANMSHEIRTPLNGMLGMLQLLQTTPLDGEQQECVDMAVRSGTRLTSLISDILDLARMEAGKLFICESIFSLQELFAEVQDTFKPSCVEKGIDLHLTLDPALPSRVLGDMNKIRQVLYNLIGNSVKFTDKGTVALEAWAISPPTGGECGVLFMVSDTGTGIPDDMLAFIFDPFTQVDDSSTRKYEGAGLGLNIVKRLVEVLDASLAVDTETGRGTTMAFTLALRIPGPALKIVTSKKTTPPPKISGTKNLRILLVEDERTNRVALTRLLEKQGCTVLTAENGKQALDILSNERFDCVLMDVQMPVMDGLTAVKLLRQSNGLSAKVPMIALTAHAMDGDRDTCLDAGMDGYLAKPVDMEELRKTLASVLDDPSLDTGRNG